VIFINRVRFILRKIGDFSLERLPQDSEDPFAKEGNILQTKSKQYDKKIGKIMKQTFHAKICMTLELVTLVLLLRTTVCGAGETYSLKRIVYRASHSALIGALSAHVAHSMTVDPTPRKRHCLVAGLYAGLCIGCTPEVSPIFEQTLSWQLCIPAAFASALLRPHNFLADAPFLDEFAVAAGGALFGLSIRAMLPKSFGHIENGTQHDTKNEEHRKPFTFAHLAGTIPKEVREIADFIKGSNDYKAMGARMPKGILLIGPPGTGKTSIARAIAGEVKAKFIATSASAFIEMYVGVGPKRIRELFDEARAAIKNGSHKKAIIFIDELDTIGYKRSLQSGGCSEPRATINELLNQMDGFNQDPDIFLMAATNRLEDLDPALTRAGRFDRIVTIDVPDAKSRAAILRLYTERIKADKNIDFKLLAERTVGCNCADLNVIVNEAAILAVREHAPCVNYGHLERTIRAYRKTR
jgi:cell division protease FtsH